MSPTAFITRIVIPVLLVFAILAVLAWVLQYLPSFVPQAANTNQASLANFPVVKAAWKDESMRVCEIDVPGHYDFYFSVDKDVEMGLESILCSCTSFQVATLPAGVESIDKLPKKTDLPWKTLKVPEKGAEPDVFEAAAGSNGVVRMSWRGKEPKEITLEAKMWIQPKGSTHGRQYQELSAKVQIVSPIQFAPPSVELGSFRGQKKGFAYCWSSTRDKVEFAIDTVRKHPCFDYRIRPMSNEEQKAFEGEMTTNKVKSVVKATYMIDVTVSEAFQGATMEQGHFTRRIPLLVMGVLEVDGPPVNGFIIPDVVIAGSEDLGKLHLNRRKQAAFDLNSEPDTTLTLLHTPKNLETTLSRKVESSTRNQWVWGLNIVVPPGTRVPEDDAVILRSQALPEYLADVANVTTWGAGQAGGVPNVASFATLINGWQGKARNVRLPVLPD